MTTQTKIKWEKLPYGDRRAHVNGIDFTIYKAVESGRSIFSLGANRNGESVLRYREGGWMSFKAAVDRAHFILEREGSK